MPDGAMITRSTINLFLRIIAEHPHAEVVIGTPPPAPTIFEFKAMHLAKTAEYAALEIAKLSREIKSTKLTNEPFYKGVYNKNKRKRHY